MVCEPTRGETGNGKHDGEKKVAPSDATTFFVVGIDWSVCCFWPIVPCNGSQKNGDPDHEGSVLKRDSRCYADKRDDEPNKQEDSHDGAEVADQTCEAGWLVTHEMEYNYFMSLSENLGRLIVLFVLTFDAARFSISRALVEPHESFLHFCYCKRVLATRKLFV